MSKKKCFRWRSFLSKERAEYYLKHELPERWKGKAKLVDTGNGWYDIIIYPEGLSKEETSSSEKSTEN